MTSSHPAAADEPSAGPGAPSESQIPDEHQPPTDPPPSDPQAPPQGDAVRPEKPPFTRTGAAWVSLAAAALVAILLITFLAQNTHSVEMSFLWMSTSTSLAVMLLIAAVSGMVITLILGTARIIQLRRIIRKNGTH